MSLKNKIQKQIKQALKKGDQETLKTLRFLFSKIKDFEIDKSREEIKDKQIIKIIQKEIKNLQESLKHFQKADRKDLIEKTEQEIKILKKYLPEQMPQAVLEKKIDKIIAENEQIDKVGPLIGIAVKQLGAKVESSRIAETIKTKLNNY